MYFPKYSFMKIASKVLLPCMSFLSRSAQSTQKSVDHSKLIAGVIAIDVKSNSPHHYTARC